MAVFATVAFAAFLLEDNHLLTLHEGKEHLTVYFRTFNGRCADLYVAVGIQKKHFVESDCIALLYFLTEKMNIQIFALFGFELLSLDFYNCVHCFV